MPNEKVITLYLTSWQKRMVMDFVKSPLRIANFRKLRISVIDKRQWVMYRQPVFDSVKAGAWNLYLTDEQISQVAEVTGIKTKIAAINISPKLLESKAVAFE